MTTETQRAAERYPDTTLPSVLPLPSPPLTPEDCVRYLRQLHVILNMNQTRLAEIMRIVSYHRSTVSTDDDTGDGEPTGGTADMPAAAGSGVQHVTVDKVTGQARFFVDTLDESGDPYWYEIGAGACMDRMTGFEHSTESTINFVDGTRTYSIIPEEGGYSYWHAGVRFYKDTTQTVTITDVEGVHFIVYDGATLTAFAPNALTGEQFIKDYVAVAAIYWDATNNKAVFVSDERHGLMDPDTHWWIHSYGGGTRYGSGLTLGDILADEDGSLNTHAELSVASGSIMDEDLLHVIDSMAAPAQIPILYKSGATPDWRRDTATNAPIKLSAGVPQYNSFSGGSWGQTAVANTKLFLMHIFAIGDPVGGSVVAIQGEAQYNTVVAAREGALAEIAALTTAGLPMPEFIALGTLIYQYNTAYANSYDCRIRTTDAGDDYVNWLAEEWTPGFTPVDHSTLTGRDDPAQHPADSVATDTAAFGGVLSAADDEVQAALDTLDDHKHDALYISVIGTPAANHFPYQTAGGELIDSGYDASDFSAAAHTHSTYLPKSAGSSEALTGGLYINGANDIFLNTTGVSGTYRAGLSAAGNQITLGNATDDLVFAGGTIFFHDDTEFDGSHNYTFMSGARLSFAEGSMMYMEKSSIFSQFMSNGSGAVQFGNTGFSLFLSGAPVHWGDGGATNYSEMETDGDLIQYGSAKIENESSVLTPAVYCSNIAATRVRTMSNNVSQNFFKWGSGATAGDSMHFIVHFSIQVQLSILGTTYWWTRGGSLVGTILKLAASSCKAIAGTVAWDGAAICFNAAGGTATPTMNETVACGTSSALADLGPYFSVNLTAGGTFTSAECRFTVFHTDTDHIALTGGF